MVLCFSGRFLLRSLEKMFHMESDYLHVFVWSEGMERGLLCLFLAWNGVTCSGFHVHYFVVWHHWIEVGMPVFLPVSCIA